MSKPSMTGTVRFRVFGRRVDVQRRGGRWRAYYPGTDGTRRAATDIVIPSTIAEAGLERYLADLCHEWASPRHPGVERLS